MHNEIMSDTNTDTQYRTHHDLQSNYILLVTASVASHPPTDCLNLGVKGSHWWTAQYDWHVCINLAAVGPTVTVTQCHMVAAIRSSQRIWVSSLSIDYCCLHRPLPFSITEPKSWK